jgi:hypothetical protein
MPRASISRRSGKQAAAVTKVRLSAFRLPHLQKTTHSASYAGLTRVSITLREESFEEDGLPGQGPAMTGVPCPGRDAARSTSRSAASQNRDPGCGLSKLGPGSAAHRFARATRCAASGARKCVSRREPTTLAPAMREMPAGCGSSVRNHDHGGYGSPPSRGRQRSVLCLRPSNLLSMALPRRKP